MNFSKKCRKSPVQHSLLSGLLRVLKSAFLVLGLSLVSFAALSANKASTVTTSTWQQFEALADFIEDKGKRTAGAPQEKEMANWIAQELEKKGFKVKRQAFDFKLKKKSYQSENLYIDIKGAVGDSTSSASDIKDTQEKILIIGAHYDSNGDHNGSLGLTDNGSGVSALLSLAEHFSGQSLPYTLRLVAFGAEERGLLGSKAFVNKMQSDSTKNNSTATNNTEVIGMINLDTIIGGDILYVHSAHVKPYNCDFLGQSTYSSSTKLREGLRAVSSRLYPATPHQLHPKFEGYPEGVTGGWSDHAPFACNGIPIAYIEATNFSLNGKHGNDGYSQVADSAYWSCFDAAKNGACNRDDEKAWGEIWHTKYDRADALFPVMKDRLKTQLEQNVEVLKAFVLEADKWL